MPHARKRNGNRRRRPPVTPVRPLVSGESIPILAAFLFGLLSSGAVPVGLRFHAFAAAAIGLVSWLGLKQVRRMRERSVARLNAARAGERMATRLHRHVPVERPRIGGGAVRVDDDSQYLTVPASSRRSRSRVR